MVLYSNYRLFCNVEQETFYMDNLVNEPTQCPNGHTDISNVTIISSRNQIVSNMNFCLPNTITTAVYSNVLKFAFCGTDNCNVNNMYSITDFTACVPDGSIRVYDINNGNTICELTGVTTYAIHDLGPLSNLPTDMSIFEVQVKSSSGSIFFDCLQLMN